MVVFLTTENKPQISIHSNGVALLKMDFLLGKKCNEILIFVSRITGLTPATAYAVSVLPQCAQPGNAQDNDLKSTTTGPCAGGESCYMRSEVRLLFTSS